MSDWRDRYRSVAWADTQDEAHAKAAELWDAGQRVGVMPTVALSPPPRTVFRYVVLAEREPRR